MVNYDALIMPCIFADPDVEFARFAGVGCRRDDGPAVVFKRDEKYDVLGCVQQLHFRRGRGIVIMYAQHATDGTEDCRSKLYNLSSRMYGS